MDPITVAMGLAQFAPQIVRWLSGSDKAGEVAQTVVDVARNVTGHDDPQAALDALRADSQAALDFRKAILAQEADLDRAYLADRADARARDVAYVQAGRRNVRADMMVAAVTLGLIACLFVLTQFKGQLPGEVVGIISTIAGIFGACLKDAFQFEFGSSRGSKDKDDLMAAMQGRAK